MVEEEISVVERVLVDKDVSNENEDRNKEAIHVADEGNVGDRVYVEKGSKKKELRKKVYVDGDVYVLEVVRNEGDIYCLRNNYKSKSPLYSSLSFMPCGTR